MILAVFFDFEYLLNELSEIEKDCLVEGGYIWKSAIAKLEKRKNTRTTNTIKQRKGENDEKNTVVFINYYADPRHDADNLCRNLYNCCVAGTGK